MKFEARGSRRRSHTRSMVTSRRGPVTKKFAVWRIFAHKKTTRKGGFLMSASLSENRIHGEGRNRGEGHDHQQDAPP